MNKTEMNRKNYSKKIILIATLLILLTFIILDLIFSRKFMLVSCDLINWLQKSTGRAGEIFGIIFSDPALYSVAAVLIMAFFLKTEAKLGISHKIFLFFFTTGLTFLIKACYARGRPYFFHHEVKAIKCICGHGMPSAHTTVGVLAAIFLWDAIYPLNKKKDGSYRINPFIFISIYLIFGTIYATLTGLARMIVGLHSLNQVFMGGLYGLLIPQIITKEKYKKLILSLRGLIPNLILAAILIIVFILGHFLYFINRQYRSSNKDWVYWGKCSQCDKSLNEESLSDLYLLFLAGFSLFFANLHLSVFRFQTKLQKTKKISQLEKINSLKVLARLFIYALGTIFIFGIFKLIKRVFLNDIANIGKHAGANFLLIIKTTRYAIFMAWVYILVPWLLIKLKISCAGDFLLSKIESKEISNSVKQKFK